MTAFDEAWDLLKGTPYFGKPKDVKRHTRTTCEHCGEAHETAWHDIGKQPEHLMPSLPMTRFNRGTYPHRAVSADFHRSKFPTSGWTRMQDPTTRGILERFAQRGAQNIATSKLPWGQRTGASPYPRAWVGPPSYVMGGPSQDAGGFPKSPELIRIGEGQVTQYDPSTRRNVPTAEDEYRRDERLEDIYGSAMREMPLEHPRRND